MPESIDALGLLALNVRRRIVEMHYQAASGHIASALSMVDILVAVFKSWKNPEDLFILSKGHAVTALYALLFEEKKMSFEQLQTYYQDGTFLAAHPGPGAHAEIPFATGSLGHGLSVTAGMAWASREKKIKRKYACLVSDGECNTGSFWEGLLFISQHRLRNLLTLVDANGLQGFGRNEEVLNIEPLRAKFEAFGFETFDINGHDLIALSDTLRQDGGQKPRAIICRTTKGKGLSFMENKLEWHYLPLNFDQYQRALFELKPV